MRSLIVSVAFFAMATAAFGQDACRTGDSTLGDQRALAELRSDEETACPCASFTGAPGLRAADYRRCTKPLLDAAFAGGSVRSECRKTARADVRTSTCGTTNVACGAVKLNGSKAPACHVKRTQACTDTSALQQTACSAQTHCSDVVTWTAGSCLDGRQPGSAHPGAMHVTYTKPSVVNPAETRVLDTVIWYPTAASGPIDAATDAVLDAPIDPSGGPFPVLVFSHGLCGIPTQSTFLTALAATRRIVVIAPSHPQSTLVDCANHTTDVIRSNQERPSEATYVLDQLLAAGTTPGSPFFGLIDAPHVGMSGHSFGGMTAYAVATSEPRIRAAVLLAPGSPVPNGAVQVPSLTMFGTDDTFVPLAPIQAHFDASAAPKFLVEIAHTGHFAFANACLGTPPDCQVPAELTQEEANQVVLRWVIPFLEIYLRGTARVDSLLAPPAPPGVSLTALP